MHLHHGYDMACVGHGQRPSASAAIRAIARSVHRPALFPVPADALRLALGDLSHLLLDSQRVVPSVMKKKGFPYRYSTVGVAMEEVFRQGDR